MEQIGRFFSGSIASYCSSEELKRLAEFLSDILQLCLGHFPRDEAGSAAAILSAFRSSGRCPGKPGAVMIGLYLLFERVCDLRAAAEIQGTI